jgi:hypothetical protein
MPRRLHTQPRDNHPVDDVSVRNMRLLLSCLAAYVAAVVLASAAAASCAPFTPAQQRARATVIFDGVALESGPTSTGVQRFRVTRYLKGSGPRIVRVNTGHVRRPDGIVTITSVSLLVKRNERWRIFARGSAKKVLQSNVCAGSHKLPR